MTLRSLCQIDMGFLFLRVKNMAFYEERGKMYISSFLLRTVRH